MRPVWLRRGAPGGPIAEKLRAGRVCARLDVGISAFSIPFQDGYLAMKHQSGHLSFDSALELLRANGFRVASYAGVAGSFLVSKDGVGAVVVAAPAGAEGSAVAFAIAPGVLVRGEVARLVDRGYQKFLRTSQSELPASASQLHAIHTFGEELSQLTGHACLYNESLGTTSDVYRYDRPLGRVEAGREKAHPVPAHS